MSIRSGIIIKYLLDFTVSPGGTGAGGLAGAVAGALGAASMPSASLKVSNDLLAGDVCVDADVTVTMGRGGLGTTFKILLYDLPEKMVKSLSDTPPLLTKVKISLGYFDTKVQQVIEGIYEEVESEVTGDKLVTTITGREKAFFACVKTKFTENIDGDKAFIDAAAAVLAKVADNKKIPGGCLVAEPGNNAALPSGKMRNPVFKEKGGSVLGAIARIAREAGGEFLMIDGKVLLGSPLLYDSATPAALDPNANLAKITPRKVKLPGVPKPGATDEIDDIEIKGFTFIVTGDPTLRPGQKITVKNLKDYATPEFRLHHVEHSFSASTGYVCTGVATERPATGAAAREIDSALVRSAASAASDISDRIRSQGFDNPVIEIASVKAAPDSGKASLYYGQLADAGETQPSVNTAVTQQEDHVYDDKPVASAFAWRKCGLITPVYPGMKAVVAHNRSFASDGIVTGYVWSKRPDTPAPEGQQGDWWLCLPTNFDTSKPPDDSTKAANDLTAMDGKRVIEVQGLKISVGTDALSAIGKRPIPGDAETCTIQHVSGAVITIKKNKIDINVGSGPKFSISDTGITMTDGTLNVQLANGKLAIG